MESITLTKELILSANSDDIAKSRYFKSSFINKVSGHLMSLRDVATFINLNTSAYVMHNYKKLLYRTQIGLFEHDPIFLESLNHFDYLSDDELKVVADFNKSWRWFDGVFNVKGWNYAMTECIPMYESYVLDFGQCSHKKFYQELKFWASENNIKLTFKNVRKNRKVIAEW